MGSRRQKVLIILGLITLVGLCIKLFPQWVKYDRTVSQYQKLLSEGKQEEAIKTVEESLPYIKSTYFKAILHFGIANTYRDMNMMDNAEKHYLESAELYPKYAWPYTGLAGLCLEKDDLARADSFLNKARKISPHHPFPYNIIYFFKRDAYKYKKLVMHLGLREGTALREFGKYIAAIECYDKMLEINPRYAEVWNDKGTVLDDLERFDEAIKCYDRALKLNPRLVETWYNKGLTLAKLEKFDESIVYCDKALSRDADFKPAQELEEWCIEELGKDGITVGYIE